MQFSRTALLLGDGIEKIKKAHVCVFGVGGVGSYVVEALARSGVSKFTLIDSDKIDITNINRQIHALHSSVGRYKTHVMKERILDINPIAQVCTKEIFCDSENTGELIPKECSYVVDAVDTVTAKIAVIMGAKEKNIPVISCMGAANKLDPTGFRVCDIYKTETCPLCRVMRREMKKRGVTSLDVVYSKEAPVQPLSGDDKALGSVSFVPSAAGLVAAGHIIMNLIHEGQQP